ncbi:AraC family transcriptional regulator [Chryseobacterium sp. WG23]|uniref:helix-turn-helix domain-containing protein n=1 Tax=Chryseobacterium sp. WG23 TaxID=2926910 RepID=UPI00211E973E|nr:AraC family transcriptional regulator [Chryseobacterium sp. WG23]MCQ9636346.1 AraC family transcriptional regulator [Chryseobacterium sp. WG23]
MDEYISTRRPYNAFLASIVEDYFFMDIPVEALSGKTEFIVPFPRITFCYYFDRPFSLTNHNTQETVIEKIIITKVSTTQISILPTTDRVKILGTHIKPFALAYFTKQPIHKLPWLINTEDLFGDIAVKFQNKINVCTDPEQMFDVIEDIFLDNVLVRDLSLITRAVELIETSDTNLSIEELSSQLNTTERTLRNHFYEHIGCSPKEYLQIVKIKKVAYQLKYSDQSLTDIAFDNHYFDQAHFINDLKKITGYSPGELRKLIPNFRFLQF